MHWRAKEGKGSFNYRCKFDVELGGIGEDLRNTYLRFQAWDKDVVKYSDCLAESTIDIRNAMIRHFKRRAPSMHLASSVQSIADEALRQAAVQELKCRR